MTLANSSGHHYNTGAGYGGQAPLAIASMIINNVVYKNNNSQIRMYAHNADLFVIFTQR